MNRRFIQYQTNDINELGELNFEGYYIYEIKVYIHSNFNIENVIMKYQNIEEDSYKEMLISSKKRKIKLKKSYLSSIMFIDNDDDGKLFSIDIILREED